MLTKNSRFCFLTILILTFILMATISIQAHQVTVQVKGSNESMVSGVTITYGSGSNYSTWTFGTTTAGTVSKDLNGGIYSFKASYRNGTAILPNQSINGPVTLDFNTIPVIMELKSSTGTNLSGGHVRFGSGTNYTTSHWPGGNTTETGQTIAELFPGTYSFEMEYNSTSQVKSQVVVGTETNTFTWTTTNVTLQYSGVISFGGSGDSRYFNKPSMELLPCTRTFHARPGGYFDLTIGSTPITKSIVALKLKDHAGIPLANGKARGGNGSSYSTWWVPGVTDATYGTVIDLVNGLKNTMSYEMGYNNTAKVITQDVSANSILNFQTNRVTMRLETCGGKPLDVGKVRYGRGSTYTTWWFPGGQTGSSAPGETHAEFFPGTYSFEMQYQGTAETKLNVELPDASPLVWKTTKVTLDYNGQISFGGSTGDSRWFNKPSMDLMAGTYKFHFRNGGLVDLNFSGCEFTKSFVLLKLLAQNGSGVAGGKATPAVGGSWKPQMSGATGSDGKLFGEIATGYTKIRMTVNQGSQDQSTSQLGTSGYTWKTSTATVKLIDDVGAPIEEGKVEQGGGTWIYHGDTDENGEFKLQMFPGSYKFRMGLNSSGQEKTQDIGSPVVFQTGKVKRNDAYLGTIKAAIGGSWQYFWPNPGSEIQLLPGTYNFVYTPDPGSGSTEGVGTLAGHTTIIPHGETNPSVNPGESNIIEGATVPTEFAIYQNYPNPFNPSTTIKFGLPVDAYVTLEVYDVLGCVVARLVEGTVSAGYHNAVFEASHLSSGMYFYRISAQGVDGTEFSQIHKMLLMK